MYNFIDLRNVLDDPKSMIVERMKLKCEEYMGAQVESTRASIEEILPSRVTVIKMMPERYETYGTAEPIRNRIQMFEKNAETSNNLSARSPAQRGSSTNQNSYYYPNNSSNITNNTFLLANNNKTLGNKAI